MKLGFKSPLTKQSLLVNHLQARLNRTLKPQPVLRSFQLGGTVPGETPKGIRYRFGPFELNTAEESLARNGTRVKIQDLPYRLLIMLAERPGEIVTREEVRQRLWPENTFVEFDNSLGVAIRKVRDALNDDADTPRYVETLPRRGYRFVAPVTVLGSDAVAPPVEVVTPVPVVGARNNASATVANSHGHSRYWMIAASVLVLVGAAFYGFRSLPRRASTKAEAAGLTPRIRARRSVAVLGFRNLPGRPEDNWLSPAFSEMLNTELGAGGGLRMISGEDVARAKRELPLTDEDSLAQGTLERLRTNPGADVVVLGSYTLLPSNGENRIRLDIRLQDTLRGETIAEQAITGNENELFELASQAGASLRQSLGVSSISSEATNAARAALPSNEQAARLYAQGRAKLWAYDFLGARELLVRAVAADPNYPLSHAALSEALWHLGFEIKARGEAQRASELDIHLPQEQRLLIEGQYRRTLHDSPRVVEAYQSLFNLFPDSLDYGLLLASAQMKIKPSDSLRTLAALRSLPPPSNADARIDMVEASAWINVDDTKARAAAKRAIDKASAQGSHVIVARTYGFLCQQDVGLGLSAEGISECANALQSALAAKDIDGAAMMRNNLAAIYFQMGDLAQSEGMFREAIAEFRQVGNEGGVATSLANFGGSRVAEGDLSGAKKLIDESIIEYQAVDDKEGIALSLNNLGDLFRQSGNLQTAATTYQQAKATAQEIDDKDAIAYVMQGLGDVAVDRGDLAAARKSYEEALSLRKQTGELQLAAETELALSRLAIGEGHAAEAETVIRKCHEQFHHEDQSDDELDSIVVLMEALLSEGNFAVAEKERKDNQALAAKSVNQLLRLQFDLVSARVQLAIGDAGSASILLQRTLRSARAHHFLGVELETRLRLAELKKKQGQRVEAQADLVALEKLARGKGFGLIAGKVLSARNSSTKELSVN
jgi:DNA-binding winged helix-turn-helix (wHTH) protein/tetratricopeptide (TPR) repeat protein